MDMRSVDYHLDQAISHLEMAFMQTKSELQDEQSIEENTQKWNQFLAFLFGNVPNIPDEK